MKAKIAHSKTEASSFKLQDSLTNESKSCQSWNSEQYLIFICIIHSKKNAYMLKVFAIGYMVFHRLEILGFLYLFIFPW